MKQHLAAFEAQLMRKLSNTEAELKKKRVFRWYLKWSPIAVGVKACLIYFLFRREFEVAFAWIKKKSVFLGQISWILKLRFEDWPL